MLESLLRVRRSSEVSRDSRAGFTLIELLVVIAIIALLVGILLPGLRKAKLEGMKAVSLANARSLGTAGASYSTDMKGYLPVVPTGVPVPTVIDAWISWGGWGKYTGQFWVPGEIFDIAPSDRPLNPYLVNDTLPTKPQVQADPTLRKIFSIPALHDPSDRIGHQQSWNAYAVTFGVATENPDGTSCYDDVGSSYLLQCKWFEQTNRYENGDWTKAWRLGGDRIRLADDFQPSRFIWCNDEYCDITINQVSDTARVKNGYGDINKAIVCFLDNHVKYETMIPGGLNSANVATDPSHILAYNNDRYTVVFPDLHH